MTVALLKSKTLMDTLPWIAIASPYTLLSQRAITSLLSSETSACGESFPLRCPLPAHSQSPISLLRNALVLYPVLDVAVDWPGSSQQTSSCSVSRVLPVQIPDTHPLTLCGFSSGDVSSQCIAFMAPCACLVAVPQVAFSEKYQTTPNK